MIFLISGATHTGKTLLAQTLLEKHHIPYLSLDNLKMGLIRSKKTDLTVTEDEKLTAYLWPIAREIIKTSLENGQSLIIEGCYIPFDWQAGFEPWQLEKIRAGWLVMTETYIRSHFDELCLHASDIQNRSFDTEPDMEELIRENNRIREKCEEHGCHILLIDGEYQVDMDYFSF